MEDSDDMAAVGTMVPFSAAFKGPFPANIFCKNDFRAVAFKPRWQRFGVCESRSAKSFVVDGKRHMIKSRGLVRPSDDEYLHSFAVEVPVAGSGARATTTDPDVVALANKKRAPSAFLLFAKAHRSEIKQANPDMSFGQVGKELGKMWNAIDDAGKAPFVAAATAAKAELDSAKSTVTATEGAKIPKPMSAFVAFGKANRASIRAAKPQLTFGGVSKELGRMWAALSPSAKAPYERMAEDDKERVEALKAAGAGAGAPASGPRGKPLVDLPLSAFHYFWEEVEDEVLDSFDEDPDRGTSATFLWRHERIRQRWEALEDKSEFFAKAGAVSSEPYTVFRCDNHNKLRLKHPLWEPFEVDAAIWRLWDELGAEDQELYTELAAKST